MQLKPSPEFQKSSMGATVWQYVALLYLTISGLAACYIKPLEDRSWPNTHSHTCIHTHTLSHTCPLPNASKRRGFSPCVALADLLRLHLLWCASSHHTALIPPRHTTIWASPSLTHSHTLTHALRSSAYPCGEYYKLTLSVLSRSQPLRLLLWRLDTKEFLAMREIERERVVCLCVSRA